jgi:hypothetical protein
LYIEKIDNNNPSKPDDNVCALNCYSINELSICKEYSGCFVFLAVDSDNDHCVQRSDIKNCSRFVNSEQCTNNSIFQTTCQWEEGTGGEDGECKQPPPPSCGNFTDASSCSSSNLSCVWVLAADGNSGICNAKSNVKCENYLNEIQCANDTICHWNEEGKCINSAPSPSCGDINESDACSSSNLTCIWVLSVDGKTGTCSFKANMTCEMYLNESQCEENIFCLWDKDDDSCSSKVHSCSNLFAETDCSDYSSSSNLTCVWIYNEDAVNGTCMLQSDISDCAVYLEQNQCNTDKIFGCFGSYTSCLG